MTPEHRAGGAPPMRGIITGILLALPLWALIGVALWWLL
jgi:hypothetical protein